MLTLLSARGVAWWVFTNSAAPASTLAIRGLRETRSKTSTSNRFPNGVEQSTPELTTSPCPTKVAVVSTGPATSEPYCISLASVSVWAGAQKPDC